MNYFVASSQKAATNIKPQYTSTILFIDSLVQQDYSQFDHLDYLQYKNKYNNDCSELGWMKQDKNDTIELLSVSGLTMKIAKTKINTSKKVFIDHGLLHNIQMTYPVEKETFDFLRASAVKYFNIITWLQQRNEFKSINQIMDHLTMEYFEKEEIRNAIGHHYFNILLEAFSFSRDFEAVQTYSDFFTSPAFNGYEYQQTAINIGKQIKRGDVNYYTYPFPTEQEWIKLSKNMNRQEQINYLVDKLPLLNCVQLGQPGGINYRMPQTAIPYAQVLADTTIIDEQGYEKYYVINPYEEIIKLKLSLAEASQLVDLLVDSSYIPAYSYHRDFFPERTVHQVNFVVNNLLFDITNKRFINFSHFDTLSVQEQAAAIQKVKEWFAQNKDKGQQDQFLSILKNTQKWQEFAHILEHPDLVLDQTTINTIMSRYDDFEIDPWESLSFNSIQSNIAKLLYKRGDQYQADKLKQWLTENNDDYWLKLWCSLYFIKNKDNNYTLGLNKLSEVLAYCDGTTFYPHAIAPLLATKDARAIQMAENILQKPTFLNMLISSSLSNIAKQLLLVKSDRSFEYLYKALKDTTVNKDVNAFDSDGKALVMLNAENLAYSIGLWRDELPHYNQAWSTEDKLRYNAVLAEWLKLQYELIKMDKKSKILVEKENSDFPSWQLDAP